MQEEALMKSANRVCLLELFVQLHSVCMFASTKYLFDVRTCLSGLPEIVIDTMFLCCEVQ